MQYMLPLNRIQVYAPLSKNPINIISHLWRFLGHTPFLWVSNYFLLRSLCSHAKSAQEFPSTPGSTWFFHFYTNRLIFYDTSKWQAEKFHIMNSYPPYVAERTIFLILFIYWTQFIKAKSLWIWSLLLLFPRIILLCLYRKPPTPRTQKAPLNRPEPNPLKTRTPKPNPLTTINEQNKKKV